MSAEATGQPRRESKLDGEREPRLDGVRGIAVIMVMQLHILAVGFVDERLSWLRAVSNFGWTGVDLFFVLSGFLITGILVRSRENPEHYFRNFYMRRSLRIFPLYYAYLLLYFVLVIKLNLIKFDQSRIAQASEEMPWLWIYGTGLLIAKNGEFLVASINHLWTLAIEEHFYFIWPAIIYFCSPRVVLKICTGGILAVLALRLVLQAFDISPIVLHVLTPTRMDSFMAGGLAAIILKEPYFSYERIYFFSLRCAIACFAVIFAAAIWKGGWLWGDAFTQSLGYTLLSCGFATAIVATLLAPSDSLAARICSARWLRFFGHYGYALYVVHVPINIMVARLLPQARLAEKLASFTLGLVTHAAIVTVLSVAVALASWHLLEKHFLRLKSRF